ncbi:MAG: addiction module protein [Kiritimatiellae bacterium]|nr:addiction module protein [Kiritimatiellia bacterium]
MTGNEGRHNLSSELVTGALSILIRKKYMSPQLLEIERKAFQLPVQEREALAERLIQTLNKVALTGVEAAWVNEAERRFEAYLRGERKGIPASRVFKQIRRDLRCRG